MLDFLKDNIGMVVPFIVFVIGWLLPPLKFNEIGKKVRGMIDSKIAGMVAERLDAFEKGLLGKDVDGNSDVISKDQLKEEVEKMKIDLNLKK